MTHPKRVERAAVPPARPAHVSIDRAALDRWLASVGMPPYGTPEYDAEVRRQCARANDSDRNNLDVAFVYAMADEMLALLDEEEANGR